MSDSLIVGIIIVAALGYAVRHFWKARKGGGCGCGSSCGCSSGDCGGSGKRDGSGKPGCCK